jgi:rhodanese-related sulfurtransferase
MSLPFISITPVDAQALLATGTALLIDVREWPDTLQARVPQSHNLPYSTFTPSQALDLLGSHQNVIIHCYHGIRSQAACLALLEAAPQLKVYNLTGGMAGWVAGGLPTTRGS